MAINANIVVNNPAGLDAGSIGLLQLNAQAAVAYWSSVLAGSANVTLQLDILAASINGSGRGGGAGGYLVDVGGGGPRVFQWPTAYKLSTGLTPVSNGAPDIKIDLQLDYVQNTLWIDPTPYDGGADIPANKTDALSVLIHEIGHAIAFNGFRDLTTGASRVAYDSTFDQHVVPTAAGPVFSGANVRQVYGSDPALTVGNLFHFGNAAPGAGSDLIPDLMNGVVFQNGYRYLPSQLDLATLADIGVGTIRNDLLTAPKAGQTLDAGAGRDIVFVDANYVANAVTVQSGTTASVTINNGTFTLLNSERIAFRDGVLAIDTEGNAGQVYRLYQAAFDRAPDGPGLSHNVRIVDNGLSLNGMANAFVVSAEFQTRYSPNVSNETFVKALYNNVLDRDPDPVGNASWLQLLNSGQADRGAVLIGFSESLENKALVASAIQHGIGLDYGIA